MAKCKNCTNLYNLSDDNDVIVGKWCPKVNDSPDTENERDCENYKCMTQSERIRSMRDEELAEFLCKVKADYQWEDHEFPSEEECGEWEEWLQSEVEEQK